MQKAPHGAFCLSALRQPGEQRLQRLATMAEAIFLFRPQLRRRTLMLRYPEQRVVTKTARALRCRRDFAMPCALGNDRLRIVGVTYQHQHTVEMRTPVGYSCQSLQQFLVIALIAFRFAGIARRQDTGSPIECIDTNSRIVSQCRQTGNPAGVTRFCQGILDKGQMGLFGFGHIQLPLGDEFQPQWAEQLLKFTQFAGIVAGDDDTGEIHGQGIRKQMRDITANLTRQQLSACLALESALTGQLVEFGAHDQAIAAQFEL
mgnify:CR=1 FL=1